MRGVVRGLGGGEVRSVRQAGGAWLGGRGRVRRWGEAGVEEKQDQVEKEEECEVKEVGGGGVGVDEEGVPCGG